MAQTQFKLLGSKRFLPFYITQFCEAFNDSGFKAAVMIMLTYQLITNTTHAELLIQLAQSLLIIPFLLFSAIAGQLSDKLPKYKLVRYIKLFEVLFMCLGAYAIFQQNIFLMMATVLLMGSHSAFFGPIKYAILPELLKSKEILGGNGLVESGTFVAIIIGAAVCGEFILGSNGYTVVASTLIGMSLLGWVSCFFIEKTPAQNPELKLNPRIDIETKKIINTTRQNRDVFLSILGISWFWLIGAIFFGQLPSFTKDVLHVQKDLAVLFNALFCIGLAVGALLVNRLLKGKVTAKYVPLGVLGMSIFIFDLYFTVSHSHFVAAPELIKLGQFYSHYIAWHVSLDLFFLAVSAGIYTVPLYTTLQTESTDDFRSRVIACNNILNAVFMVLAAAFTMLMIIMHFSIIQIFFAVGIANAFAAVYICKLLPHALVKSFIKWLLQALYKVEIKGMDNYPAPNERFIIIANHTSFIDILLISAFLPDQFTVAINTDIAKKWWIKPIISLVEIFPIDPTNPMSTKSIIQAIRNGKKCVIFPEGRLTVTGSLMKIYEGPALIADKSQAKLVPIRIDGAQYTPFTRLKGRVKRRWFPKITITVLPACKLESSTKGHERRHAIGTKLYSLMTDMIFESSPYKIDLFDALLDARETHGGRYVIAEDIQRKPVNYNQFIMRSFILGKAFSKVTEAGEIVGVMLPTSVTALLTFFAVKSQGRIPAMLNFSVGFHSLHSSCTTAPIKTIYTSRQFIQTAKLDELIERLKTSGLNIIFLEDLRKVIGTKEKIIGALSGIFARRVYHKTVGEVKGTDPGVVLFTSGSEGSPKAVVLSNQNILANVYQMAARVDFTSRDIMFNALPVFHCFGLTAGAMLPTMCGIRTFYYPSPLHYRVVPELVYDTNATIMFGTDTFLNGYARYAHSYDFYSVRYVFAGAEKVKEETIRTWAEKFGVRIFEGYGATETAPVISTNTPMQNKLGSVGCPLSSIKCKLQAVDGIKHGGRLFVSGPNVMLGYIKANNPGKITPLEQGWHDTGDIVNIDDDGFITILGRAKRFAKIGGEMVSLSAVENFAADVWPEHQHAAVAIPDPKKGEQVILVTDNQEAKREDIVGYVKNKGIADLYTPKTIKIIGELPLLATGKLDYNAVHTFVVE